MSYDLIAADVPWQFVTRSAKGRGRSADRHYPTLTVAEIKALDVIALASPNSYLLFWVTDPMVPTGLEILHYWGFDYKTVAFYWYKLTPRSHKRWHMGTGYSTRANPEQCWLAARGKGLGRPADRGVSRIIESPVREHSRKPDSFYSAVERLWPSASRVELFARELRPGWAALGDEVGTGDLREVLRHRRSPEERRFFEGLERLVMTGR